MFVVVLGRVQVRVWQGVPPPAEPHQPQTIRVREGTAVPVPSLSSQVKEKGTPRSAHVGPHGSSLLIVNLLSVR
jgi:hypothetical protein